MNFLIFTFRLNLIYKLIVYVTTSNESDYFNIEARNKYVNSIENSQPNNIENIDSFTEKLNLYEILTTSMVTPLKETINRGVKKVKKKKWRKQNKITINIQKDVTTDLKSNSNSFMDYNNDNNLNNLNNFHFNNSITSKYGADDERLMLISNVTTSAPLTAIIVDRIEGKSVRKRKKSRKPLSEIEENRRDAMKTRKLEKKRLLQEKRKLEMENKRERIKSNLRKLKRRKKVLAKLAKHTETNLPHLQPLKHFIFLENSENSFNNQENVVTPVTPLVVSGDLSCLKNGFKPAPSIPNADIKYLRNDLVGVENSYIEVEYICHYGYELEMENKLLNNKTNIYCSKNEWIGTPPKCKKSIGIICEDLTKCEHICYVENNEDKCSCFKGFRLMGDRCVDINECEENDGICELGCYNTIGSYRCKCLKGYRTGELGTCVDINECLLRNGHGPCQDTCINFVGGYNCTCDGINGTKLSEDRHSCEDLDECTINNGGCSHTCLNTMGRAYCVCPFGWTLNTTDWKSCNDIDECEEQLQSNSELVCEYGCINTPGSFKCVTDFEADQPMSENDIDICPNGFGYNFTTEDCRDIDECSVDNGNCYDRCINTIGSYHCSCRAGYVFGSDKQTCLASNSSADIACPPLFPPTHGYLECSRPTSNGNGRMRITNRPGSQCILRCPPGYRTTGKYAKICANTGEWIGDGNGACIRYPTPRLQCPSDLTFELSRNKSTTDVQIDKPKTDVNWERDVVAVPPWAKNLTKSLSLNYIGGKNISYTATHPLSKLSVTCNFTITIHKGSPPKIEYCPENQKHTLINQDDSLRIFWDEPVFSDNVKVTSVTKTNRPGNFLTAGSHQIIYDAQDAAGYHTKCVFKILITLPRKHTLNHPLPIYYLFN